MRTANFIALNLEAYEVACHTSEAPGLPALQGRLPSPQDGRVAIGLLPLAGLLLRRADMLDKGCPYHGHTASVRPTLRPCCSGCPKPFSTGFHPLCLILRPVRMAQPSAWGFFCRAFPVPAVTRLQVAEIFGKRHDHALREIEYILTQAPEIFIESNFGCMKPNSGQFLTQAPEIFIKSNFGVVEYPVRRGFGTGMVKAYLLSKDGFPYAGETFLPAHPAR